MTEPTKELLIAERNADLVIRENIIGVKADHEFAVGSSLVSLIRNDHMLGSAQVKVRTDEAVLGYSGDFQWPAERVMEVEQLVLDSTNGYPDCVRRYTQNEAEACLVDLTCSRIRQGPIHVQGFRGTLQRGLSILTDRVSAPFLGSAALCKQIAIYRAYGYAIAPVIDVRSPEGREIINDGRYVRFYGKSDRVPVDISGHTSVRLSAFMTGRDDAMIELSPTSFSIALSDHADFPGIVEYVRATKARQIVCDNTRGGHAIDLARALCALGFDARPSANDLSREWGM